MAISKEKKTATLQKLGDAIKESATLVFVQFHKLPAQDVTAMRKALREKGVGYTVAKKTLIGRALDDAKFEGETPALPGEVALAYGVDQIAPAQSVREFEKQFEGQVSILGGVFDGVYKDKVAMTEIASIPTVPVLRGMFLNVINSPIQGLVIALNGIAEKKG